MGPPMTAPSEWAAAPGRPEWPAPRPPHPSGTGRHRPPEDEPAAVPSGSWLVIGRALGTVVVSVHGILEGDGAERLGDVLRDLIQYQGNLAVVVDLSGVARLQPTAATVFLNAAVWAEERGGSFRVHDPADRFGASLDDGCDCPSGAALPPELRGVRAHRP